MHTCAERYEYGFSTQEKGESSCLILESAIRLLLLLGARTSVAVLLDQRTANFHLSAAKEPGPGRKEALCQNGFEWGLVVSPPTTKSAARDDWHRW